VIEIQHNTGGNKRESRGGEHTGRKIADTTAVIRGKRENKDNNFNHSGSTTEVKRKKGAGKPDREVGGKGRG